jgi:LysR family glycine cleavage system transcriptional activator
VSGDAEDLNDGRFDAAIRNGYGRWPGLRAVKLLPSIFMPLCAPKLKSAALALANPRRALEVPLLGRPDWWTMWYRARGFAAGPSRDKFGTSLAHEYLDIAAAVAGQGIAIGSPLLFARRSIPEGSCPRTTSWVPMAVRSGSSVGGTPAQSQDRCLQSVDRR